MPDSMDRPQLEQDLLELERRFWQAIKDKDIETALDMTDDPCIIAGSSGFSRVDHNKLVEIMKTQVHSG